MSKNAFNHYLGLQVLEETEQGATVELIVRPEHYNSIEGVIHGGVITTLLDVAMGHAAAPHKNGIQQSVTAEIKVNFLRAARGKRLLAQSQTIKRGRQLIIMEGKLYAGEELVAVALGTYVKKEEEN